MNQPEDSMEVSAAVVSIEKRVPTGTFALATMSEPEFEERLKQMTLGRERAQKVQRAMMREGVHFGKVPGKENDKDARHGLLKAGAELLCQLYNLVPAPEAQIEYGDLTNVTSPAIRVRVRCLVHAGSVGGPIVGVGYGAANSWEVKYRYRGTGRKCPACEMNTVIKSKWKAKGGPFEGQQPWVCLEKQGGCGTEFAPDDTRLTEADVSKVPNGEALDLENTLLKMAEKRAKVDGTIAATATSDLFTQDVEDMTERKKTTKPAQPVDKPVENQEEAARVDLRDRFVKLVKQAGGTKKSDVVAAVKRGLKREQLTLEDIDKVTIDEWTLLLKNSDEILGLNTEAVRS